MQQRLLLALKLNFNKKYYENNKYVFDNKKTLCLGALLQWLSLVKIF
jgi:hypothetical protein